MTVVTTKEKIQAVYEARKNRTTPLQGSYDKQGRWYPTEEEESDNFTESIRSPSAAWPYSYLKASLTKKHITALAECNPEYLDKLYSLV